MKLLCARSPGQSSCFTLLFSALFLLAFAPRAVASKQDAFPDWIRSAAHQPIPTYSPDTDAVVLLDETTYVVDPDGRATIHRRRITKILHPQGRRDAVVRIGYDRETKINSLHVWSIGPDGHEYSLKDNEILDRGYWGDTSMYVEDRVKVATAPGSDPGGVVAYEYEQKERPFLTEKTWFFQDHLPHLKQSFQLELPAGFEFGTVWAHHGESPAVNLEQRRWQWELKDTPGIDLAHVLMRPYPMSLAGRMTIHYTGPTLPLATTGTWKSIGQWYQRLSEGRLAATPEITAKAALLTQGKTDFYDRTEAVGEFVQQHIRYFGIELGIGGYQPHAADEVYRNEYGDCKDKATLLTAMLSSIGVHTALLMVDTHRGVIDPDAPSIVGNHMIAAIEVPTGYNSPKLRSVVTAKSGKRYLVFDPTWENTPYGQLESGLQGSYGLLMEGPASQIIELPVLSPQLNTIRRSAKFQLQADGALSGTVTEKSFGGVSEERRVYFGERDLKDQQEYLDHALERDFTSFKVADVTIENVKSLNKDFTLFYTVGVDHFARLTGPLLMVRPRVLGSEELYADNKQRSVPINLGETREETDDYEISIPVGYAIDELPEPVKVDMGFATYESASEMKSNTLHYTRTYTVRQVTLAADRYPDVQKLSGLIEADEQRRAVFKKLP